MSDNRIVKPSRLKFKLEKAGVKLVDEKRILFECQQCGQQWSPILLKEGKLPKYYWYCPNHCNWEYILTSLKKYDDVLNKEEAVEYLKISRAKLDTLIRDKRIPYLKVDNRVLFLKGDLFRWLKKKRVVNPNNNEKGDK